MTSMVLLVLKKAVVRDFLCLFAVFVIEMHGASGTVNSETSVDTRSPAYKNECFIFEKRIEIHLTN